MRTPVLHRPPDVPAPPLVLDPAQERVVSWRGPGTCVVLGSPGTGATTALVHAVAARLGEVPASEVLVLARDRDAVRRMRSAIARSMTGLVGSAAGTVAAGVPTVTTFHGLAYALVQRTSGPGPEMAMPRLLSGAEEDARIRDVLRGAIADGEIPWPGDLLAATTTLGFANDLRALLARARELDLHPRDLAAIGRDAGIPAWEALGRLAEIDSEVMALEGVIDYSGLLELAIDAAAQWPGVLRHIYVDDFQEAGALQRRLLRALTGPVTSTLVAADPDVAAFGFRGGDRLGAVQLIDEARADVLVLDQVHAGAGGIWATYADVRRQPALPGLPAPVLRSYRFPDQPAGSIDGMVEVRSHDTWGDLVAWVADDLRRLHLGRGAVEPVAWQDMAVIARSTSHLEGIRRALSAAGVPVSVHTSDIPLPAEPAVATLLAAASAAIAPEALSPRAALELVTGPLLALDAAEVRQLARSLRDLHRVTHPSDPVPAGTDLVRDLLAQAITHTVTAPDVVAAARPACDRVMALGRALAGVRDLADEGASPGEVLWGAWAAAIPDSDGMPWSERLRRAALGGHAASGHDLDAVLALFATAERLSDRYSGVLGIQGLLATLQGQRVAAERVAAVAPSTPAVSLLTPHLAVGRRWDHVVVVGAQEGAWPPPLGGSSVLRVPEWEGMVAESGPPDIAAALRRAAVERMEQERRLFALAVSRARVGLVIATVQSETEQPSRFVDDVGRAAVHRPGRPPRSLTLDGMVARLRSVAQDPAQPLTLRRAAVHRLAVLADAVDDSGAPLAPRADPSTWWGLDALTPGVEPIRPADRPVALSGSGLATLQGCPLRWFLSRVVRAEGPRGRALAVGSLVHVLAERAARGDLPAEPDALLDQVDLVWSELPFDAPWESIAERAEVSRAIQRLCAYLRGADGALAVEHGFTVTIPLRASGDGPAPDSDVVVRGAIDRIEVAPDGRVRLIDFKTARTPPSGSAVESDPQLGMYQLAVRHGALGDLVADPELGGAALVQLRVDASGAPGHPRIQEQSPMSDTDDGWLLDDIAEAISRVRSEDFPALVSSDCRTCPYLAACPAQPQGQGVLT